MQYMVEAIKHSCCDYETPPSDGAAESAAKSLEYHLNKRACEGWRLFSIRPPDGNMKRWTDTADMHFLIFEK